MNEISNKTMAVKSVNTLMGAYEDLVDKVKTLKNLEILSNTLLEKFNRTEDDPSVIEASPPDPNDKNIVDLFDDIANQLDETMNRIGNNLERVVQMID